MNLQTKITLKPQQYNQIDYHSEVLLLGSCFSENIDKKFRYYKFKSFQNPFGILFHPLAIEALITKAINKKVYTEADIFFNNEQWHCFDAHSKLSSASSADLLERLNSAIHTTYKFLKDATHIFITLGTAWTYRHIETDATVANCHKVPQKKFLKVLLSVEAISASLDAIMTLIKSINQKVIFIFTVSPVRHIKDGFIENTQSKSHLISAIHQVVDKRQQIYYFPSFEILMDELRDYRFYTNDMLHPNTLAVDYIWEKFKHACLSEESYEIMCKIEAIQKGLEHKPFNPKSDAHQKFISNLKSEIKTINSIHPHIEF